jgi:hypothetical protein
MKKVKVFLTAITILGIVSVGLASKPRTTGLFCANSTNQFCDVHVPNIKLGGAILNKQCVVSSQEKTCPTVATEPE